ncbi:MAG: autotransporter outer membrane beta-barrel domain-containing protein [Planctomycetia bacterium]|nr:autotransporter outer membrane beta-barrel domain-containing protein [Planctomycetia bacterium]
MIMRKSESLVLWNTDKLKFYNILVIKILKVFISVLFLFNILGKEKVYAQAVIASSGEAVTQAVTLENLMIMETLRDFQDENMGRNKWAAGYGYGGFARGRNMEPDPVTQNPYKYAQKSGGFILAADWQFSPYARRGIYFTYNNTRLKTKGISAETQDALYENVETNNFFWGAYTKYSGAFGYFIGSMAGGYSHLHENRQFLQNASGQPFLVNGHADTGAWRALVYGEIGTEYRVFASIIQPFWGLQYYYSRYGSVEEELTYASASDVGQLGRVRTNSFRSILGLRICHPLPPVFRSVASFDFMTYWVHEFLDFGQVGQISVQNFGETELFSGIYAGRDWAILAPVLTFQWGRAKIWGSYNLMFNADETINMGMVGLEILW